MAYFVGHSGFQEPDSYSSTLGLGQLSGYPLPVASPPPATSPPPDQRLQPPVVVVNGPPILFCRPPSLLKLRPAAARTALALLQ